MGVRFHPAPGVAHRAVGGDDEGGAFDAPEGLAVGVALFPDAVLGADLVVGITEQGERQAELGGEALMRLDIVGADAEDHRVAAGDPGVYIAQAAGLGGAAWRVVGGVKVEHHRAAAEAAQGDVPPAGGGQGKIGGQVALVDGFGDVAVHKFSFVAKTRGPSAVGLLSHYTTWRAAGLYAGAPIRWAG